jgi:hypothetical protein
MLLLPFAIHGLTARVDGNPNEEGPFFATQRKEIFAWPLPESIPCMSMSHADLALLASSWLYQSTLPAWNKYDVGVVVGVLLFSMVVHHQNEGGKHCRLAEMRGDCHHRDTSSSIQLFTDLI